jgi:prolyl oligopeptidase
VYVREGIAGKDQVLFDPTAFAFASGDKTSALDWWYPSEDGALIAYGASLSGDEQSTLHVRDVATGKDRKDIIPRTRMSSVAWLPDGSGFFYSREPDPGSVPKGEEHYHRKVYQHVLGREFEKDPLIFPPAGTDRPMTDMPMVMVTPSGRFLIVRVSQGWAKSSVYLKDLKAKDAKFVTVVEGVDALFDPMPHKDAKGNDLVLVRTNDGAPNFRIYSFDPTKPERAKWKEIVAERDLPIRDVDAVGRSLFISYLRKASSYIEMRSLDGAVTGVVDLPWYATASVPHGALDGDEALLEVQSYTMPPRILHIPSLKTPKPVETKGLEKQINGPTKPGSLPTKELMRIDAPFDTGVYKVDQIEAKSKDGTAVTAFVVHKSDVPMDGTAPTILYGYGGFNISQTPSFNRTVYAFLERGGVYVVANLRGGAEYGEAWHRAGMLDKKQNVFDDAIAVAEKLVADKWTSPTRLAIQGGSNGGLLVGALLTQRPELFRAVVCAVPLLDMLRFQHFLIAKLWVAEYGSADDPKQYPWLKAYSPYHHVIDGTKYPAVLLMTAESDARVDPMHARKMAARLQAATASENPILLRVETKAGHGVGKPRSKQLEELSDQYTFLFEQLGVKL